LAQLVAWPGPDRNPGALPPIAAALAHAAALLRAPRILVVWNQPEEPLRHIVRFSQGEVQYSCEPAGSLGNLVVPGQEAQSVIIDLSHGAVPLPVSRDFIDRFGIRKALSAPFQRELCRGRIFVLDPAAWSDDDLLLVELIAGRIGVDLEHFLLRQEIQTTAALREREHLARDLHDGLLQNLTAAAIQLKLGGHAAETAIRDRLEEVRRLLAQEQKRIRRFVEDNRALVMSPTRVPVREVVARQLEELERQWGCEIVLQTSPADLAVSPGTAWHLRHLINEAVSNAARHGLASQVRIALTASNGHLCVSVADDGSGFRGLCGRYADEELRSMHIGPASLRSRISELGGTLSLVTSPKGSRIEARLPL
jgi:signal transduction histidine kinase